MLLTPGPATAMFAAAARVITPRARQAPATRWRRSSQPRAGAPHFHHPLASLFLSPRTFARRSVPPRLLSPFVPALPVQFPCATSPPRRLRGPWRLHWFSRRPRLLGAPPQELHGVPAKPGGQPACLEPGPAHLGVRPGAQVGAEGLSGEERPSLLRAFGQSEIAFAADFQGPILAFLPPDFGAPWYHEGCGRSCPSPPSPLPAARSRSLVSSDVGRFRAAPRSVSRWKAGPMCW